MDAEVNGWMVDDKYVLSSQSSHGNVVKWRCCDAAPKASQLSNSGIRSSSLSGRKNQCWTSESKVFKKNKEQGTSFVFSSVLWYPGCPFQQLTKQLTSFATRALLSGTSRRNGTLRAEQIPGGQDVSGEEKRFIQMPTGHQMIQRCIPRVDANFHPRRPYSVILNVVKLNNTMILCYLLHYMILCDAR